MPHPAQSTPVTIPALSSHRSVGVGASVVSPYVSIRAAADPLSGEALLLRDMSFVSVSTHRSVMTPAPLRAAATASERLKSSASRPSRGAPGEWGGADSDSSSACDLDLSRPRAALTRTGLPLRVSGASGGGGAARAGPLGVRLLPGGPRRRSRATARLAAATAAALMSASA